MTDRRRERDMKTVIEAGMSSNIIQPGHLPVSKRGDTIPSTT